MIQSKVQISSHLIWELSRLNNNMVMFHVPRPHWSSADKCQLALNSFRFSTIKHLYQGWYSSVSVPAPVPPLNSAWVNTVWDTNACRKRVISGKRERVPSTIRGVPVCVMLSDQSVYTCAFVSASVRESIRVSMRVSALWVKQGLAWRSKSLHNSLVSQSAGRPANVLLGSSTHHRGGWVIRLRSFPLTQSCSVSDTIFLLSLLFLFLKICLQLGLN